MKGKVMLNSLYRDMLEIPESAAKVNAMKDGMRLADQSNDAQYSYFFRRELIDDAAYDGRFSDVRDALGALGWILKKWDDGELDNFGVDPNELIDKEQWICRWITMYPDIGLPQLDNLLEDLKGRLQTAGYQLRFYYEAVMIASLLTDQSERAAEAYKEYRKGRMDRFLDCDDCIGCRYIKYLRYAGDHKAAFKEAASMAYPGYCNMNPKTAYNELVASAVENNDYDGMDIYQQRAYKMIAKDQYFLDFIGYHMQYYAHFNVNKGLELYKKHLAWLNGRNRFPLSIYDFHMGAAVLFNVLDKSKQGQSFKAVLDINFPLYNPSGIYHIEDLKRYHYEQAAVLAAQFDKRNGTDYYINKLERLYNG